jgi:uncharacterized membrane protein YcfT
MFIFVGGILIGLSQLTFVQIDNFVESIGLTKHGVFELNATSFIRFGQVVSLLGVLMLIDGNFKIKAPLFLKLGQNTLPIYIVHVILLYGGILGFGLKPLAFNSDLGPWSSITVSLLAIAFFVVMIYFIEPLEIFYNKQLNRIKFRKKS